MRDKLDDEQKEHLKMENNKKEKEKSDKLNVNGKEQMR